MPGFFDEARHDPTPSRLRRAEEEGQIASSPELVGALVWIAAITAMALLAPHLWASFKELGQQAWGEMAVQNVADASPLESLSRPLLSIGRYVMIGLVVVAVAGGLAHATQTRFRIFPKSLRFDIGNISPVKGLGRLFSANNFLRVGIGFVKLVALATVAAVVLYQDLPYLLQLPEHDAASGSSFAYEYGLKLMIKLCVAMAVVGCADYGIRWLLNRRKLRMSDEDLREEQRSEQSAQQTAARQRIDNQR